MVVPGVGVELAAVGSEDLEVLVVEDGVPVGVSVQERVMGAAQQEAVGGGGGAAVPGWYELSWEQVAEGRERYVPLAGPKTVLDAVRPLEENLERAMQAVRAPTYF